MPNIDHSSIHIDTLLQGIKHDPASWNGISLLYFVPEKENAKTLEAVIVKTVAASSGVLVIRGHGDVVLLGCTRPDAVLADTSIAHCWVSDIGAQWQQVCGLIEAMADRAASTSDETKPPSQPLSILVVEDDPMTSKMVAHHLHQFGTVTTTKNAREATANNNVHNPDIIFLDIHYKDDIYDGFDVLTNILSTSPKAFVVMFSANRDPATILKALSLGAQGFIAKPFHAADFSHYLTKFADSK